MIFLLLMFHLCLFFILLLDSCLPFWINSVPRLISSFVLSLSFGSIFAEHNSYHGICYYHFHSVVYYLPFVVYDIGNNDSILSRFFFFFNKNRNLVKAHTRKWHNNFVEQFMELCLWKKNFYLKWMTHQG